MKTVKVKAPVERDEIGNLEEEIIIMSRAADGTETFELEVETYFEQRGNRWVPAEAGRPGKLHEPKIRMRRAHSLSRLEVLRWFVMNYLPDDLHRDFRPVTHPKKGGAR